MAKQQLITVVHPELTDDDGHPVEAYVLPGSVKLYVRKGWSVKEESLQREEGEAPLTEADKAQLKLAQTDPTGPGNQEPQAPQGSNPESEGDLALPKGEGSNPEGKDPVTVVEPGTAGQPGENGNSGESTDSRRRGR